MKKRFKLDILTRNNRVKIMEGEGMFVNYSVLSDKEYLHELSKKIVEEATEMSEAMADKDDKELKYEIADVLEVVENVLSVKGFDIKEIEKLKMEKQEKYGKFDKKLKINWVEMDENNKALGYYLARPQKYPEINIEE